MNDLGGMTAVSPSIGTGWRQSRWAEMRDALREPKRGLKNNAFCPNGGVKPFIKLTEALARTTRARTSLSQINPTGNDNFTRRRHKSMEIMIRLLN
jgi:hypothetical protein